MWKKPTMNICPSNGCVRACSFLSANPANDCCGLWRINITRKKLDHTYVDRPYGDLPLRTRKTCSTLEEYKFVSLAEWHEETPAQTESVSIHVKVFINLNYCESWKNLSSNRVSLFYIVGLPYLDRQPNLWLKKDKSSKPCHLIGSFKIPFDSWWSFVCDF